MSARVADDALDLLFRNARTHNSWTDEPVPDAVLRQAYELARMAPTSANSSPMRIAFVRSKEAKERLRPALSQGNLEKTMKAPVTAIVAYDLEFYEQLPRLFSAEARGWFAGSAEAIRTTAFRNGSLQGAYFMIAARMLGLDCGPMSGFDAAKVDGEFWAGTKVKTNFICNLGHGDPSKVMGRLPRFDFADACKLL